MSSAAAPSTPQQRAPKLSAEEWARSNAPLCELRVANWRVDTRGIVPVSSGGDRGGMLREHGSVLTTDAPDELMGMRALKEQLEQQLAATETVLVAMAGGVMLAHEAENESTASVVSTLRVAALPVDVQLHRPAGLAAAANSALAAFYADLGAVATGAPDSSTDLDCSVLLRWAAASHAGRSGVDFCAQDSVAEAPRLQRLARMLRAARVTVGTLFTHIQAHAEIAASGTADSSVFGRWLLEVVLREAASHLDDYTPLLDMLVVARDVPSEASDLVNSADGDGNTALHLACMVEFDASNEGAAEEVESHTAALTALLDAGVKTETRNKNGETPLLLLTDRIKENTPVDSVRVLLEKKASVTAMGLGPRAVGAGKSALMLAAAKRRPALLCAMLELCTDADLSVMDTSNQARKTAMQYAFESETRSAARQWLGQHPSSPVSRMLRGLRALRGAVSAGPMPAPEPLLSPIALVVPCAAGDVAVREVRLDTADASGVYHGSDVVGRLLEHGAEVFAASGSAAEWASARARTVQPVILPFAGSGARSDDARSLAERVLNTLLSMPLDELRPSLQQRLPFFLSAAQVLELCDSTETVLRLGGAPALLKLRAPVKIFGDIHGQMRDLLRLFRAFGTPTLHAPGGDLAANAYLFLGDYVDRGHHELEVVCLLFALKVAHPASVHLLRGNHEVQSQNNAYGFSKACERIFPEQHAHVYKRINDVFEWLPLAAVIEAINAFPQHVAADDARAAAPGAPGGGTPLVRQPSPLASDSHASPGPNVLSSSSAAAPSSDRWKTPASWCDATQPPHQPALRKIYCVHGGCGLEGLLLKELQELRLPLSLTLSVMSTNDEEVSLSAGHTLTARQLAVIDDALWSDPCARDDGANFSGGARGAGVRFNSARARDFCSLNGVSCIVRAHQVPQNGVELFAEGLGVTVFSAADYPEAGASEDRKMNRAALLQVGRDGTLHARVLLPAPRD
jgi:hypothetical protein